MIRRHLLNQHIQDYIQKPDQILVVEGVRQTGKTTAIQMVLSYTHTPYTMITLSDETHPVIQLRDAKTFDEFKTILARDFKFTPNGTQALVLDEAQRSKTLYGFIMQMQKEWAQTPIILSGSVMGAFFDRKENEKVVSPAGRVKKITCRPFSFHEFLDYTNEQSLLETLINFDPHTPLSTITHQHAMTCFYHYLTTGGFPRAIATQTVDELYDYFQVLLSFFSQDADRYIAEIVGNQKVQYGVLFRTILESIAKLTGSLSTRSSILSTDSPAYRVTLPALLDAAEQWHFLLKLAVKTKTITTKQGSSSKKYLWDVGVLNHLVNLSRTIGALVNEHLLAALLESFVAQELLFYLGHKERLSCWKSQHKQEKEMDFLAQFPESDVGIEVKASTNISHKAVSQLAEFLKFGPSQTGYCVYLGEYALVPLTGTQKNIAFIPPYLLGTICRKAAQ